MLNIKQLTNHTFRFIAIASLFVALAGLLISPLPASADGDYGPQASPYACGTARVEVFDDQTGSRIMGAKVVAYNPATGESVVLHEVAEGVYTAQLRADEWKIYVSAPGYTDATVAIKLEPRETEDVKVTLANTRDVPASSASQW